MGTLSGSQSKWVLSDLHYWITLLLSLAVLPLEKWCHLPMNYNWVGLGSAYWLVLGAQSIFVAALLYEIGSPRTESKRVFQRFFQQKGRIVAVLVFGAALVWAFSWFKALILTVDAIAILEFRERTKSPVLGKTFWKVFVPAAYLFGGFLLVFSYNDIILSFRFFGATDSFFNAADRWLMHGVSVSDLSRSASHVFPASFFRLLEYIYFGMFPQIGAGVILSSMYFGRKRGLQLVGTILFAYYVGLVLFCLWPSQGPFYLCPDHFQHMPKDLRTYSAQVASIALSRDLWDHVRHARISFDYFIAFPCMHIAQPIIVMWFLRHWRRVTIALAIYDVLLVAAILLLEWHYVVDVIGGFLVAAVAIAVIEWPILRNSMGGGNQICESTAALG